MWYACFQIWNRFAWYGVAATCEHPWCNKEIDRWISYACWWEPYSDLWCDRYFCWDHLYYTSFDENWVILTDDVEDDVYDRSVRIDLCERCRDKKDPFPYKPETKQWIDHINTHESWTEYRDWIKDWIVQM